MALTKVSGDFIDAGSITQGHLHSSHGITTTHIAEGDKLFFTNARVDSRIGSLSSSDLSEGTNLYYTDARARAAISATGSLSYNSTTGVMSFTMPAQNTSNITEGSNLYYTDARADARIAAADTGDLSEGTNLYYTQARFNTAFTAKSTSDLSEGTNLYYTDARADARITAADTDSLSEGSTNLYYTDARADARVALIVDSAPGTLNTLNELADALGDDANFSTTVTNSIATKLPLAGGTLTGQVIFPSAATTKPVLPNGFISRDDLTDTSGRHDIWGISEKYYPSNATAGDAWGIQWSGTPNDVVFVGSGTDRFTVSLDEGNVTAAGIITATGGNSTQWNTAYGWGDHGAAGYLTSFDITTQTDGKYIRSDADDTASGIITLTKNTASNIVNNAFSHAKTIIGGIHFANGAGTNNNGKQAAITFQGSTASEAQAGIYVHNNDSQGTHMMFATTNSYATGPQAGITLLNNGNVTIRGTVGASNFSGSSSGTNTGDQTLPTLSSLGAAAAATTLAGYGITNAIQKGADITSGASWTTATKFNSTGNLSQAAGNHALSVNSANGNDAFMSFHIASDYAIHFGLDGATNRMHVGGWSEGTGTQYQLYDSRDFSVASVLNSNVTLATLGYSGATNANYITNNNQLTNGAAYITASGTSADSNLLDGTDWGSAASRRKLGLSARTTEDRNTHSTNARYHTGVMGWGTVDFNTLLGRGSGFFDTWSNPGNQPSTETSHWNGHQVLHYTDGSNYHHGYQMAVGAGNPAYCYIRGWWANGGTGTAWAKMYNSANLTLAVLGYTGATNANYITNNNQLTNGAGYLTSTIGGTKLGFVSGSGGSTFGNNHYSMGVDIANSAWSSPNYSDLIIGYHTGIRIGAAYGGTRFYANSPTTDTNNTGHGNGGEALILTVGGAAGANDIKVEGIGYAGESFRSPIFYDNNNTAYAFHGDGTSVLNAASFAGVIDANGGHGGINITNTSILSSATSTWTGNPSGAGKIQYHSNRWYIVSDSSSNRIVQFRKDGSDKSYIDNDGRLMGAPDLRVPIYYDTNTAYYGDFASNSHFNTMSCAGGLLFGNNYGVGVTGLYTSTRIQTIFNMGAAYKLPNDGNSTSNAYGLYWSHQNAGSTGGANNLASHGIIILEAGSYKGSWGGGRLVTPSDIRGTLFYDYNNTGYYVDPASTTIVNDFRCDIMYDKDNTAYYVRPGSTSITNDFRANIFYSRSNTAYYSDPESTSIFNAATINYINYKNSNFRVGDSTTMNAITSGGQNVAFGPEALGACNTGTRNFAYGYAALASLTSGANNIAMGDATGYNVSTGSNNLLFGVSAGRTGYQSPQSIAGVTSHNHQIHMGNESHTTARIQISWTVNSDARDKTDITPIDIGLDFVKQLNPVTYRWDKRSDYEDRTPDGTNKLPELTLGFLAQEVEVVEKSFGYDVANQTNLVVDRIPEQDHYGITYEKMVPILTKAIQEQQTIIDDLKSRLETLENQ